MVKKWEVVELGPGGCGISKDVERTPEGFGGCSPICCLRMETNDARLIVAAVNAIRACAEPMGMEPLEFARRLESVPGFGLWVGFATDLVEDVLEGEPLKGGPPTGLLNDQTQELKERDGPDA